MADNTLAINGSADVKGIRVTSANMASPPNPFTDLNREIEIGMEDKRREVIRGMIADIDAKLKEFQQKRKNLYTLLGESEPKKESAASGTRRYVKDAKKKILEVFSRRRNDWFSAADVEVDFKSIHGEDAPSRITVLKHLGDLCSEGRLDTTGATSTKQWSWKTRG
jgi:hypothetical protein